MKRLLFLVVVTVVWSLGTDTRADLIVNLGDHVFPEGSGTVFIPILIEGTDPVHGFDAYLQVGDGLGGNNAPVMSYLGSPNDLTNNFMASSPHLFLDSGSDLFTVAVGGILSTLNANISPQTDGGMLLTLVVDLTGKVAGESWPLIGDDTGINGAGAFYSQIDNVNAIVPSQFLNGSITIAVPEPSTLVLAALGGMAILCSLRHRRQRKL